MKQMIMEIRNAKNLQLLDSKEIKSRIKYKIMCKKLNKLVRKHHNKYNGKEFLVRETNNSYLVMSGNFGYVIGLKKPKSRWL